MTLTPLARPAGADEDRSPILLAEETTTARTRHMCGCKHHFASGTGTELINHELTHQDTKLMSNVLNDSKSQTLGFDMMLIIRSVRDVILITALRQTTFL